MEQAIRVEWIDSGRDPKCAPNPEFPNGMDVDLSNGAPMRCMKLLPYPAKRCGYYVVECTACGLRVGVTTAGRPDDPRTVKLGCLPHSRIQ